MLKLAISSFANKVKILKFIKFAGQSTQFSCKNLSDPEKGTLKLVGFFKIGKDTSCKLAPAWVFK